MKKILLVSISMLVLAGCGSSSKSVTCNLKNNADKTKVVVEYDDDKNLEKLTLNIKQVVDKENFEFVTEDEFEETLQQSLESLKVDGVEAEVSYDKKKREIEQIIEVNVEKLDAENYNMFGIKKNMDIKKFVSTLESVGYKCDKIK